jgi:hypothetical protein
MNAITTLVQQVIQLDIAYKVFLILILKNVDMNLK